MLKDKIILITGASRGIGKACAQLLAENGAITIINYHHSKIQAQKLEKIIRQKGGQTTLIKADVSQENQVNNMFKVINEKYKKLDVLINNAGILKNNLLLTTPTFEFDKLIAVNCKGTFLCTRFAAKMMMRKQSGKIINLSSVVGRYGNKGQAVYAASKAFIIGFTKSVAKELGPYNITVNAIAPGLIETDMTKNLAENIKKDLLNKIHLKRTGTPEDVAKVALFLSSSLSDYVSGQVIGVDGCQVI